MSEIIRDWNDLRKHGIEILTGEACRLGLRTLCDVSAKGRDLVQEVIGAKTLTLAEPWNGGALNGEAKVGSLMLPYDLFTTLAMFALVKAGAREVMHCGEGVYGAFDEQDVAMLDTIASYCEERKAGRVVRKRLSTQPGQGTRHTHAASGRTE